MPTYQLQQPQAGWGPQMMNSPAIPAAGGFVGGVVADQAWQSFRTTSKVAAAGLAAGGLAAVNQLLVGQQAATVQSNAGNIASAAQARAFTAGGATGAEVGALRGDVVGLANNLQTLAFYLQMSNGLGLNSVPAQPIPAVSATAGTAVTPASTSNNSGILAIGGLALVAWLALR